jgi:spore coat polysaccharide biosynthesis predicted glycosyltransferase SpsG
MENQRIYPEEPGTSTGGGTVTRNKYLAEELSVAEVTMFYWEKQLNQQIN